MWPHWPDGEICLRTCYGDCRVMLQMCVCVPFAVLPIKVGTEGRTGVEPCADVTVSAVASQSILVGLFVSNVFQQRTSVIKRCVFDNGFAVVLGAIHL